jgi:hypothetical protein
MKIVLFLAAVVGVAVAADAACTSPGPFGELCSSSKSNQRVCKISGDPHIYMSKPGGSTSFENRWDIHKSWSGVSWMARYTMGCDYEFGIQVRNCDLAERKLERNARDHCDDPLDDSFKILAREGEDAEASSSAAADRAMAAFNATVERDDEISKWVSTACETAIILPDGHVFIVDLNGCVRWSHNHKCPVPVTKKWVLEESPFAASSKHPLGAIKYDSKKKRWSMDMKPSNCEWSVNIDDQMSYQGSPLWAQQIIFECQSCAFDPKKQPENMCADFDSKKKKIGELQPGKLSPYQVSKEDHYETRCQHVPEPVPEHPHDPCPPGQLVAAQELCDRAYKARFTCDCVDKDYVAMIAAGGKSAHNECCERVCAEYDECVTDTCLMPGAGAVGESVIANLEAAADAEKTSLVACSVPPTTEPPKGVPAETPTAARVLF